MKTFALLAGIGSALLLAAAPAAAVTIDFEDLSVGAVLSNQYTASKGVTFAANGFSGAGGPTGSWATNSNMSIVAAGGSDTGGLGSPPLVSGNMLRSFNGWLSENGDPSFSIIFTNAISAVSLDFAGISTPSSTRIFVYNGANLLSTITSTTLTGQQRLSYSAASITKLIVTPGDFFDWVGVDNLTFTPLVVAPVVPEPATWAMMLGGLGLAGASMRRARRTVTASVA